MIRKFPFISMFLSVVTCGLMLLPEPIQTALYFDHQAFLDGAWWTTVSGQWMHADSSHLLWNVIALFVLGAIIERRSKTLLAASLLTGMLSVGILLLSPLSEIQRYCGLSGLLNTLLVTALYLYWRETRSRLVITAALLSVAKVAVELHTGVALFTDTSWPPYVPSHAAGLIGGCMLIAGYFCTLLGWKELRYRESRCLDPRYCEPRYNSSLQYIDWR